MASITLLVVTCSLSAVGKKTECKRNTAWSACKGWVMGGTCKEDLPQRKYTKAERRMGLALQRDFHAFRRGPHPGIVVARLLHHGINAFIRMVGIVVKEHQFLGAAL